MNAGKGMRIEKTLCDNYMDMAATQATVAPETIHAIRARGYERDGKLSIVQTRVVPEIGRPLR